MKTVKVRIAVVVAPDGSWNSCGWSGAESDEEKMELALEVVPSNGEARYYLEAELPLPCDPTIQAEVKEDKNAE